MGGEGEDCGIEIARVEGSAVAVLLPNSPLCGGFCRAPPVAPLLPHPSYFLSLLADTVVRAGKQEVVGEAKGACAFFFRAISYYYYEGWILPWRGHGHGEFASVPVRRSLARTSQELRGT